MLLLFKSLFEGFEAILIAGLNLLKSIIEFLAAVVTGFFKPVKAGAEKGSGCVTAMLFAFLVFLVFTFRNTACQAYSCVSAGCQGLDRSWSAYLTDSGSHGNGDDDSNGNSDVPAFVTVLANATNVRSGCGTGFDKLCTLKKGQRLSVLSKTVNEDGETWFAVELTGKDKEKAGQEYGWVRGDLVTASS